MPSCPSGQRFSLACFCFSLDGILIHCRITPSIEFAGTHYTERHCAAGHVRIKSIGQEHNIKFSARTRTQTARPTGERTNFEATALPESGPNIKWSVSGSWIDKCERLRNKSLFHTNLVQ